MKCIVRKSLILLLILSMAAGPTGCGKEEYQLEQRYDAVSTTEELGITFENDYQPLKFFAQELTVGGNENILAEGVTERLSEASALFNLDTNSLLHAKNVHERLYPASTTKILTALVALKYGELSATTTVSEDALVLETGSTVCGLSAGDVISLEELLYGLMMCSGNDAANVIGEMISGTTEEFASLMNREALTLGATNSHFVNPHGLHDDDHYTTAYDLYLIFQEALKNETFRTIISTKSHTASFTDSQGEPIVKEWQSTNRYLSGDQEIPEGVNIIGGKTGTTNSARYCLVLYSENVAETPFISIVLKADSRDDLYYLMTELLKKTCN